MPDIVLTTLNARYAHAAFGLRYLLANMAELSERACMLEFGIGDNTVEVLGAVLQHQPRIVGVGVYIWNVEPATRLVADLRRVRPDVTVVLGGPEVSHETRRQSITELADYVVTGEADVCFPDLCRRILAGNAPADKVIAAPPPTFDQLRLPYHLYDEEDVARRVIYVEASRGCPFTCEFCLSALEIPVRQVELSRFLAEMQRLLDRGALQFKFVDRTFNLNIRVSQAILRFFLDRYQPGMFLHFEMIPDRLPESLRGLIAQFPPGALQFEIGVQTFNPDVGRLISRRQDNAKLAENFRFLRRATGVHIHADLIVGLPGESEQSFGDGFDRLAALDPQEIQVGMLKRLRGTPITRHDQPWEMIYSPHPPYEILRTKLIDFPAMQRLRRFARFWDLIGNSGNFVETRQLLRELDGSIFAVFMSLSEWIHGRERRQYGISLVRLAAHVFDFLTDERGLERQRAAEIMWRDYTRGGRDDRPAFLREFDLPTTPHARRATRRPGPRRQAKHA